MSATITKYIKIGRELICKYKFSIICAVYLCLITYVSTIGILQGNMSKPSMLHALSLLLLIAVFAKIKNTAISAILTVVLSYFVSLDAYFAYTYGSPILPGIMASIFETNSLEAKEALSDAAPVAILIFAISTALLFLSKTELKSVAISAKKLLLVLLAYWILFVPFIIYRKLTVNESLMGEFRLYPYETTRTLISKHFPLVSGDIATYLLYKREMSKLQTYVENERSLPDGITLPHNAQRPQKVFLIIGESSYREHYSLYGYHLPTTPFLDSLALSVPERFSFYNGVAPATLTRDATRMIFSFSSTGDIDSFFAYKNMIDLAHDCGYETIWLSNQGHTTKDGSYVGCVIEKADYKYYESGLVREDLDLVTKAKEKYTGNKKQFFVIHLNGSHLSYPERYDDIDKAAITQGEYPVIDYDRTIHHTDRVIKEVYKQALRDTSSVVVYLPDHGEIIGMGHGFLSDNTSQFLIPFVTINNSKLPVDSIVNKYVDRDTRLLNTTNTIYIMSEILGYTVADTVIRKALADGLNVLNADGKVYPFSQLQAKDPNNK